MSFKDLTQGGQVTLRHNNPMSPLPGDCADSNQVTTHIINADCAVGLKTLPPTSIDLVMTSPPYADRRKHTYGGIPADQYVEWFLPIADELYRVLKPKGSLILNIKEHVVNGERHTYVLNLIIEMRKRSWIWTEEYVWYKRNAYPGKWPNRFRDAWERCIHFTKARDFAMYQEAVMVPMGDWRHARLNSLRKTDGVRQKSKTNSGFGSKMANWIGRKMAYPANVLHMATECGNKGHSAAFPASLPEWFIKLFTKAGDTVLDPFMGSGTTLRVAQNLNRNSIGIEVLAPYCEAAKLELAKNQTPNIPVPLCEVYPKNRLDQLARKRKPEKKYSHKTKEASGMRGISDTGHQ